MDSHDDQLTAMLVLLLQAKRSEYPNIQPSPAVALSIEKSAILRGDKARLPEESAIAHAQRLLDAFVKEPPRPVPAPMPVSDWVNKAWAYSEMEPDEAARHLKALQEA